MAAGPEPHHADQPPADPAVGDGPQPGDHHQAQQDETDELGPRTQAVGGAEDRSTRHHGGSQRPRDAAAGDEDHQGDGHPGGVGDPGDGGEAAQVVGERHTELGEPLVEHPGFDREPRQGVGAGELVGGPQVVAGKDVPEGVRVGDPGCRMACEGHQQQPEQHQRGPVQHRCPLNGWCHVARALLFARRGRVGHARVASARAWPGVGDSGLGSCVGEGGGVGEADDGSACTRRGIAASSTQQAMLVTGVATIMATGRARRRFVRCTPDDDRNSHRGPGDQGQGPGRPETCAGGADVSSSRIRTTATRGRGR